jgi:hypothetical protein
LGNRGRAAKANGLVLGVRLLPAAPSSSQIPPPPPSRLERSHGLCLCLSVPVQQLRPPPNTARQVPTARRVLACLDKAGRFYSYALSFVMLLAGGVMIYWGAITSRDFDELQAFANNVAFTSLLFFGSCPSALSAGPPLSLRSLICSLLPASTPRPPNGGICPSLG